MLDRSLDEERTDPFEAYVAPGQIAISATSSFSAAPAFFE
jgi:hypothetical protein